MRVQVHLEWRALGDALFLPYKESVQEKQKVVQIAGNVKCSPPLDEANVFGILSTIHHRRNKLTNGKLHAMSKTNPSGRR